LPTDQPEVLAQQAVRPGPAGAPQLQLAPETQLLWLETSLALDQRDMLLSEFASRVNRLQGALMAVVEFLWASDAGKTPAWQGALREVAQVLAVAPEATPNEPVTQFVNTCFDFGAPSATLPVVEAYGAFRDWCTRSGATPEQIPPMEVFRSRMLQIGFTTLPVPSGLAFMGVSLKSAPSPHGG
jgi:hypothetical protein